MQEVIVTIDAEGDTKVEAKGVVGSDCAALTRAIEQALGSTVSDVKKPEFYQQQKAGQRAGQG
jgi:hypothetical protein